MTFEHRSAPRRPERRAFKPFPWNPSNMGFQGNPRESKETCFYRAPLSVVLTLATAAEELRAVPFASAAVRCISLGF